MKARVVLLLLFAVGLALAPLPSWAQLSWANGPSNGNVDAWAVDAGSVVSDSFTLTGSGATITGANFAMWLLPGDSVSSAELSITSEENGGVTYFDQMLSFTQGSCTMNAHGFNVCDELALFNGPSLNVGTYWFNLQSAATPSGDPVYWDENSGPDLASQNMVGSIPSESYTVVGECQGCTGTTGTVPEPTNLMLFGSGILLLAGLLRYRLTW